MSHEHHECCGCSTDPIEREREFADVMRRQAQDYLNKEDLPIARSLLASTRTLLSARGGISGEKGVWLLVAEAHIPEVEGNRAQALVEHQASLALSEKDLGPDHLATGICLLNVAESLLNLSRNAEAKPLFERAHKILTKSAESYKESDEYMSTFALEAATAAQKGAELAAK